MNKLNPIKLIMVDAIQKHRESNRLHYQRSIKNNIELMEIRRMTALAYYYMKVQPLKDNKQPKPKKVKRKVKVRVLSIEKKTVFIFFE
jgi:hypothetical protein